MQLTVPMLLVDTWLLVASMRRLMPKSQILQVNPAQDKTLITACAIKVRRWTARTPLAVLAWSRSPGQL